MYDLHWVVACWTPLYYPSLVSPSLLDAVMTIANNPDIGGLQTFISQAAASPYIQTGITEAERQDLYQACTMLSTQLETPLDRLSRSSFDVRHPGELTRYELSTAPSTNCYVVYIPYHSEGSH